MPRLHSNELTATLIANCHTHHLPVAIRAATWTLISYLPGWLLGLTARDWGGVNGI